MCIVRREGLSAPVCVHRTHMYKQGELVSYSCMTVVRKVACLKSGTEALHTGVFLGIETQWRYDSVLPPHKQMRSELVMEVASLENHMQWNLSIYLLLL